MTIQHDYSDISDDVKFEFWYLDLDASEKDKSKSVSGYNIKTIDVKGKCLLADYIKQVCLPFLSFLTNN